MLPHFWTWFFSLPAVALLLALAAMSVLRLADYLTDRPTAHSSFFFAVGLCLAFVGFILLLACVGSLLLFLLVITFQGLHLAGIV